MAIFNWAGTSIGANIVDPNGVKRRIRHDAYDANIFNGIIYRKDVESIFTVFEKYFKYKDWKDFDYRTSNCKDRFSIPSFYEELLTK